MKRFVSMLLALLLVFTCAACSSTKTEQTSDSAKTTAETAATETEASAGNTAASTDPIRIGVSAAITGAAPLDGERSVQGIKMAVSEINAAGGVLGRPLEIVVEDDANDSATAVNVVNKLVSDQSIVALLGPHRSANAMAGGRHCRAGRNPLPDRRFFAQPRRKGLQPVALPNQRL